MSFEMKHFGSYNIKLRLRRILSNERIAFVFDFFFDDASPSELIISLNKPLVFDNESIVLNCVDLIVSNVFTIKLLFVFCIHELKSL